MVEPISTALAIGAVAKGIGGILGAGKQKEAQQQLLDAQLENFDALIEEQKLDAARAGAQLRGSGIVGAGARGAQFDGSIAQATTQSVSDTNLKSLRQIRQLQFQKTLTELRGQAGIDQQTGQQIGSGIGVAGDLVAVGNQAGDAGALKDLQGINGAPGGAGAISAGGLAGGAGGAV